MSTNEQPNDGLDSLIPIETAINPYDAIGSWWGRAVLRHALNNGAVDRLPTELMGLAAEASVARRSGIEENIGGFAQALAGLLIETNGRAVRVDYNADPLLLEAAERAGMPADNMTTFPWHSSTIICPLLVGESVVIAKEGYGAPDVQIWPPAT